MLNSIGSPAAGCENAGHSIFLSFYELHRRAHKLPTIRAHLLRPVVINSEVKVLRLQVNWEVCAGTRRTLTSSNPTATAKREKASPRFWVGPSRVFSCARI